MLCLVDLEIALEALHDYAKTKSYKSERVRELQVLLNELLEEVDSWEYEPLPANRAGRRAQSRKKKRKKSPPSGV